MRETLLSNLGVTAVVLFLAACVFLGTAARFYIPGHWSLGAALAVAGVVAFAAAGASPRRLPAGWAGVVLLVPVWAAFGFWTAASGLGREALPFLVYPLAASAGVIAGLTAWRWQVVAHGWRLLPLIGVLIALLGSFYLATGLVHWGRAETYRAPEFRLPLLAGGTLNSAALRGKTVVLAFWATWCEPCREELPRLQAFSRRYATDRHVVFYLVNVGEGSDTEHRARRFLRKYGIVIPTVFDSGGRVADEFRAGSALPARVVVGPHGFVRYKAIGYVQGESTFPALRHAIAQAAG